MNILLVITVFNTMLLSASSLGDQVHQKPADIYTQQGESAKINCSHTISSYNRIYWYKQSNRQLQFLGYMYLSNGYPEDGLTVKMAGSANKDEICTLTIEGLSLNSSAVYFCAASRHSETHHCSTDGFFRQCGGKNWQDSMNFDENTLPPRLMLNPVRNHHIMILFLCIRVILVSGASLNEKVRQTPAIIFYKPGETAKINCSHSIQDYNKILWYKQSQSKQLQFLGYMNVNNGYPEEGEKVKIEGSATIKEKTESGALTVKDLKPQDSGVYFCAVSKHSDVRRMSDGCCLGVEVHRSPTDFITNPGVCLSLEVRQSPSEIITNPGVNVQIFCSHDKTDYRMMLWYQRSPGDTAMKLIGYLYFKDFLSLLLTTNDCRDSKLLTFKMMPSHLIIAIITVFWIEDVYLSKEQKVFQSPAELFSKPNALVNLSFTHQIQSYDTILWYQRSAGDTSLKLIGYMSYRNAKVETPFQGHFEVSGDGEKTAHLHILNTRHPEDSGEYFGAASQVSALTFHQSSPLIVKENSEVQIDCSHDDTNLLTMLWYQQRQNSLSMNLIGYTYGQSPPNYEGRVDSVTFEQSPSQIVEEGTEELEINCSYDDTNLPAMLWYQHKESSQSMSLIGFTVLKSEPTYEGQFERNFSIKREDYLKGSLIIHTPKLIDMIISVLLLSLLLDSGLSVVVLQSGDQLSHPGLPVTMDCSMGPGFSMSSYTMLWYRQKHYGATVDFLTKEYDQTVGRFLSSVDPAKNKFSLQITELFVNDSSTYYCAASHRKVESVTFEQSSSQVASEGTTELEINCSHDDSSLQVMLWYQHKESNRSLSLIGYTVLTADPVYENQFTGKFSIKTQDRVRGSLIINTVTPADSAVYYCAASTHWRGLNMFVTALYLTVLTHSGLSVVVLQSGDQVSPPGVPVTMNCSMGPGFTMSSYNMLWYRQKHYGAAVEFLLTEFDQTVGHFKASLDAAKNKFSLLITELFVNDSSTYYCAAMTKKKRKQVETKQEEERLTESVTFKQTSLQLVTEGTKELEMNCSHDGSSLSTMLWYQHKPSHQSMSLIGYTVVNGDPQMEDPFRDRFQLKRENVMKGSLIIQTLNPSDSAVYYCAASAQ
ncbi:hypothetical protein Q8A73_017831 [Channa argus]|nr:hypothetical protein Q8A73_017831 [Channa argus]